MYQAQQSHLPLKVNMGGVIPAIFASSILLFPASISQWFGGGEGKFSAVMGKTTEMLNPGSPLYLLLFTAAIVFFCFFYAALMFNPRDRKSTRLNSSHVAISYAVFCLQKKKEQ